MSQQPQDEQSTNLNRDVPAMTLGAASTGTSGQSIILKRDVRLGVPLDEAVEEVPVRRLDLTRLKRRLTQATSPAPSLTVIYSILFGTAATCALSIIPLTVSKGLEPWVIPLYLSVSIFSCISASACVWVDNTLSAARKTDNADIIKDIAEIESMFDQRLDTSHPMNR